MSIWRNLTVHPVFVRGDQMTTAPGVRGHREGSWRKPSAFGPESSTDSLPCALTLSVPLACGPPCTDQKGGPSRARDPGSEGRPVGTTSPRRWREHVG